MQISAIQNQTVNSARSKKQSTLNSSSSFGLLNNNLSINDSFTKSNTSFKGGGDKATIGGVLGIIGGGIVGVFVAAATGGTAIPLFLAAYYAGVGATAVAGAAIGDALDKKDDEAEAAKKAKEKLAEEEKVNANDDNKNT